MLGDEPFPGRVVARVPPLASVVVSNGDPTREPIPPGDDGNERGDKKPVPDRKNDDRRGVHHVPSEAGYPGALACMPASGPAWDAWSRDAAMLQRTRYGAAKAGLTGMAECRR